MAILGELALWIALPISVWGLVLAFLGGSKGRGDLVLSGERSVYAVFLLILLASLGIVFAFLGDQFQYWYVANYSNRELDTFFKVSGLWAGQRGSLVFWALFLSFFSAVTVFQNRRKNREFMPYVVGVLLTVTAFFIVICLFVTNPFERLPAVPADGRGLNPQLQNYWMTIHPPTLYAGFTAFTVPFAFAIAALLSGRLDSRWIEVTRRWVLVSWFFLANGIVFGMRWAYEELGWGGYWFWDPVENASLLPWLAATAFLHSIMIQENRGMLKVWNMSLVILTFVLTIFATFLTRSGLIESVHTFAQHTTIAYVFLGFMVFLILVSGALVLWRLPKLRSENHFESFVSRESAFLLNNLILLGALFAVLWGTLFPLITEGLTGSKVAVGPPFFNQVNVPIGLVLLALMGIGPVIAWRRASRRNLRRNFARPLAASAGLVLLLLLLGMRQPMALLTFGLASFVLAIIVIEFWKGTKARGRIEGEGFVVALLHLVARNRRRWGGYIVHVGVVIIFAGFAGSEFDVEVRKSVEPGETIRIASPLGHEYSLTYEGISSQRVQNMHQWIALLSVARNGRPVGTMTSEKRQYITTQQPVTEVGIRSTPLEDLYVILAVVDDMTGMRANEPGSQRATFQVMINPLVGWIWYGAFILSLGTLVALWPERTTRAARAERPGSPGAQEGPPAPPPLEAVGAT